MKFAKVDSLVYKSYIDLYDNKYFITVFYKINSLECV